MTYHRMCDQQRQPCPTAWLCEMGCNFTNAELPATTLETRNSDSSNPGYPFELLDAPGNFWDSLKWWQKLGLSCVLVAVLWLVAAVVFGK